MVPVVGLARGLIPSSYRREWLARDVVAGIVLSTLLVPQGMAYAELAGLPPITGLYTSVLCLLGYAVAGRFGQAALAGLRHGPGADPARRLADAAGRPVVGTVSRQRPRRRRGMPVRWPLVILGLRSHAPTQRTVRPPAQFDQVETESHHHQDEIAQYNVGDTISSPFETEYCRAWPLTHDECQ